MIYGIRDKPKTFKEWVLYPLQQVFSVLTATLLIATLCGTPLDAGIAASGIGTVCYLLLTAFKSPMYISNAGATVGAVCSVLAFSGGSYLAVAAGGLSVAVLYCAMACAIKKFGTDWINKLLPPVVVGAVIMVIGINLSTFTPTYVQIGGDYSLVGVIVALSVMIVTAVTAKFGRGFVKTIPFLVGLAFGYALCVFLTITLGIPLVDFSVFNHMKVFSIPDFSFLHWDFAGFQWIWVPQIVVTFVACALPLSVEHIGDHKSLSAVIGTDLIKEPGLHRTLVGDGIASFIGTCVSGLPNTSYGESISCTSVSGVGSTFVILVAALIMILASFFRPLMAVFESIPFCVFGGVALLAYGSIAFSGLNILVKSGISYDNPADVMVVSSILTVGIGGLVFKVNILEFSGVALAMIVGVIMNLLLRKEDVSHEVG